MTWRIKFHTGVENEILRMPPKLQARVLKLLDLIELHGANLGEPHTKALGDGLFEIRAKAQEGIARSFFCYLKGNQIYILNAFIKKSNKIPKKEIELAKSRMKEVKL